MSVFSTVMQNTGDQLKVQGQKALSWAMTKDGLKSITAATVAMAGVTHPREALTYGILGLAGAGLASAKMPKFARTTFVTKVRNASAVATFLGVVGHVAVPGAAEILDDNYWGNKETVEEVVPPEVVESEPTAKRAIR